MPLIFAADPHKCWENAIVDSSSILLNNRSFYQPANGFGEICSYFLSFGCR